MSFVKWAARPTQPKPEWAGTNRNGSRNGGSEWAALVFSAFDVRLGLGLADGCRRQCTAEDGHKHPKLNGDGRREGENGGGLLLALLKALLKLDIHSGFVVGVD